MNNGREQVLKLSGPPGETVSDCTMRPGCSAHSTSASVVMDVLHLSLVPQFSSCFINPVPLWKTLWWRGLKRHVNGYGHAWGSCNRRPHKRQMGHILMYSPLFCHPSSAQQGCWWTDLFAESQVPRFQPSSTASLSDSVSLIWWELVTTNDTWLEKQSSICINIEECKCSKHLYCTLGEKWKLWGTMVTHGSLQDLFGSL